MPPLSDADKAAFTRLLNSAMYVLAQRDHSCYELQQKLQLAEQRRARGEQRDPELYSTELLQAVTDYCLENGWLNEQRFIELFIKGRSRKGYGPQRIKQELMLKGISRQLADEAMAESDIDWQQEACQIAERKFGLPLPTRWPEKAKVMRYLQSRGFYSEDIQSVFTNFDA